MLALRSLRGRCAALLAVCLLLAGAAVASADVEPNDVISQAEGPIAGGVAVTGTFGAPDDFDYYVFYVQGQQQIHLTQTMPDGCAATLLDTDGGTLPDDFTTPSGTNRYFVSVGRRYDFYDCSGASYSFRIDPASAVVAGPATDRSFVQTGEPNESPAQAIGPLAGGVNYRGSIDTNNDQDWFSFFVAPGVHQVDISVTDPVNEGSCSAWVALGSSPDFYGPLSASADWTTYGHVRTTLNGPASYQLSANTSCTFGSWQFRIDPPDALTPTLETPPPPAPAPPPKPKPHVSHACKVARSRVHAWSRRVHTLTVQLHHAHGAHSRHVLRVYLKAARRHLASAVAQRRGRCPGGR